MHGASKIGPKFKDLPGLVNWRENVYYAKRDEITHDMFCVPLISMSSHILPVERSPHFIVGKSAAEISDNRHRNLNKERS